MSLQGYQSDQKINCGIMMEWWTGGYFRAATHRVSAPPDDQRNHIRCGVFYFSIPNDDVRPNLLTESPVLRKAGVKAHFEDGKTIDARTFSRARVSKVGKSDIYKKSWGDGQRLVEVIGEYLAPVDNLLTLHSGCRDPSLWLAVSEMGGHIVSI